LVIYLLSLLTARSTNYNSIKNTPYTVIYIVTLILRLVLQYSARFRFISYKDESILNNVI